VVFNVLLMYFSEPAKHLRYEIMIFTVFLFAAHENINRCNEILSVISAVSSY